MKSLITIVLSAAVCMNAAASADGSKPKTDKDRTATYTNPVIPGIADAGVMKYAGKYYLGGVRTYGDFFVSSDLVNWDKRVHVFDLDNEWTHGTGAKNNQVHADDISYSGGLFHLLFSVNYWGDDRHIVHITHATSPSITGPYRETRADQWFENRIDPHVFCDEDGRLYLYMVKFTDGNTIWARPMKSDFTFAGDAVCQFSSQPGTWETLDNRVAEGPFVIKYRGRYYMMYNANHTATEYGNYRLGVCEAPSPMAFGPGGKYPWPVVSPQTEAIDYHFADLVTYGSGKYVPVDFTRNEFTFVLSELPKNVPMLKIAQNGGCEVSVNGHVVNPSSDRDYRMVKLDRRWLRQGTNTVTVRCKDGNSKLIALALYDMPSDVSGDMLLTPGQPNIVRGPNGWEWWLVYMANNAWNRSQFIDRIHFAGGRLTVDGISGDRREAPAMPQYAGKTLDGSIKPSDAYLLEVTFAPSGSRQAVNIAGTTVTLPDSMSASAGHVWRMEKNHDRLTAWIDNVLVSDNVKVSPSDNTMKVEGQTEYVSYNEGWDEWGRKFSGWNNRDGLLGEDSGSILEADSRGLQLSSATDRLKSPSAGNYEYSVELDNAQPYNGQYGVYAAYADKDNYVRVTIAAGQQKLVVENHVKGKRASVKTLALDTLRTCYPDIKYSDTFEKQYRFDCLTNISSLMLPLLDADNDPYAASLSIEERKEPVYRDDMAARMDIAWLDGDTWRKLEYKTVDSGRPGWQKIVFPQIKTKAIRMINRDPHDNNRNVYRIMAGCDFAANVQLRIEKRDRDVRIFADNRYLGTVKMGTDSPARVGLYSLGTSEVHVANSLWYAIK